MLKEKTEQLFDEARCRGMDPEFFFPERGQSTAAAKAVCASCPVVVECLQEALDTPSHKDGGIWGGTSERERRYIRRLGVTASEYLEGKATGVYTYNAKRGRPRK